MTWIPMQEVRNSRMSKHGGHYQRVKTINYSFSKYFHKQSGKDVERIIFNINSDIAGKAGFKKGDKLNLIFEPKTKEAYFEIAEKGGWILTNTSKNPSASLHIQIPYWDDLGYPKPERATEVDGVHVKLGQIRFSLAHIKNGKA